MNLQTVPVSDLQPAPYNPRITLQPGDEGWERLKRSIREFDLVQPIVWNSRTGHVVGGHQRLAVLKAEGIEEVDCVVVDLSLEREKALNIALNNDKVGGRWDEDLLHSLLGELQELPEFDIALTGFDERQLRDMAFEPAPIELKADNGTPPEAAHVVATLEVVPEHWDAVQSRLDELLAGMDGVRVHVRFPQR